ncbi:hypothetical protein SDC9_48341 [bioreactor metagenome]|uniref:Holin n=1 Tax=bioreactor metagenome TaxID=1076179 RepID=A0A644WE15_9ZZZZ
MDSINKFKAAVACCVAALTALWGWFGWFVVALCACMLLDYAIGSAAAVKNGEWSSKVAREGLWHKLSIIVAVAAACILDLVVGMVVNNIPSVELPFVYSALFAPLVIAWYILTELGSILENTGKLGAPQPAWFKKAIAAIQSGVDSAGDKIIQNDDK